MTIIDAEAGLTVLASNGSDGRSVFNAAVVVDLLLTGIGSVWWDTNDFHASREGKSRDSSSIGFSQFLGGRRKDGTIFDQNF